MRVQIQRVSGMPHNVQVFVDDRPGRVMIYVDTALGEAEAEEAISEALTALTKYWRRAESPTGQPRLRVHTG
ncbi:hypothetical protein [Streptomyces sp. Ac-502]|uniref:hypothetical protein n=1 Tax=Streptomyces sp. Ac-502 TaxID=3342801 RepID=UPI0038623472